MQQAWRPFRVSATFSNDFIAFEYTTGDPPCWNEIVEGLPDPIVVDGMIAVGERPGMGVDLVPERARRQLAEDDRDVFD